MLGQVGTTEFVQFYVVSDFFFVTKWNGRVVLENRGPNILCLDAQRFSLETNPVEIPLPDGSSVPNAAMTPVAPSIPAHYLMPQARAGILKHTSSTEREGDERGEPPGPPVGLPPLLKTDEDYEVSTSKRKVRFGESETKVIIDEFPPNPDDDYGPVDSTLSHLYFTHRRSH